MYKYTSYFVTSKTMHAEIQFKIMHMCILQS